MVLASLPGHPNLGPCYFHLRATRLLCLVSYVGFGGLEPPYSNDRHFIDFTVSLLSDAMAF